MLSAVTMLRLCHLICILNLFTISALKLNPHQNWNYSYAENENNSSMEHNATNTTSIYYDEWDYNKQDINVTNITYYSSVVGPMDILFTPSLVMVGVSGNVLSIYVFYKSKLRSQSTSQYLSALAISDSVFLGQLLPPWLSTMEINGLFHQNVCCKGFVYVSYVTCCLSSWLVIAFTIERFVAVQYPLQRPSVCTVRRARYIIFALTVASAMLNLPVIYFAGSTGGLCNIEKDKLEHAAKFNWVDTTVTFTIPLILILVLNTWIAIIVCKLERERVQLMQQERVMTSTWQQSFHNTDFYYRRSQQKITNMLLIVSSTFVVFNCPAYSLRVCGYTYDMDASDMDDKWMMAQTVATMLFNANFGINFFLYCLTGQNFRRALQQTVPCCGWLARTASAVVNRSNRNHAHACSITTSAASTGTDATCIEMSTLRPNVRRRHRRSGNCVLRWTFDNSRQQRRGAAVSGASESIQMHEITPRPGTSLEITDERARPASRRPVIESRRRGFHPMQPAIEPKRTTVSHMLMPTRRLTFL